MVTKKVLKNEILFAEGSEGTDIFFIISGKVRVYKTINSESVELATFEKGDFIGEMSMFLNEPRTATIEAIEDTEVQVFNKQTILEQIKQNPQFAYGMISMLTRRIKNLHAIISKYQGIKKSYELMYKK